MATFDNSYRKCYNKCNDDNKNVISHQTGKNALVRRFSSLGYKIMRNARKRRTANLHKIWEYKKPEFVRRRWTAKKVIPIYKQGITLLKICHRDQFVKNISCGYNIVIIFPLLSRRGGGTISSYDRTESTTARTEAGGKK